MILYIASTLQWYSQIYPESLGRVVVLVYAGGAGGTGGGAEGADGACDARDCGSAGGRSGDGDSWHFQDGCFTWSWERNLKAVQEPEWRLVKITILLGMVSVSSF